MSEPEILCPVCEALIPAGPPDVLCPVCGATLDDVFEIEESRELLESMGFEGDDDIW